MSLRTNSSGLTYWVTRPDPFTECQDCGKRWGRNGHGAAAIHHRATGHTVRVEDTRIIVYETPTRYEVRANGDPNQLAIEGG